MLTKFEEKMNKTITVLQDEFISIRAGRANPNILDKVKVDYYGSETPINQLAGISVAEARVLVIQPYDVSIVSSIEKAIYAADLGLNPQSDGKIIRITFPPLTEERRKELGKSISKIGEDSKVAIRAIRRDANDSFKAMKKNGELTEDELKSNEDKVQKMTDKFCATIDEMVSKKQKEVLEI